MSELVMRIEYINFLRRHGDKQVIKVVSGVRRAGKSTLFKLFQDELLSEGVNQSQIIAINFEDISYHHLLYYDTGLRQLVLRDHLQDYRHILENIIYLELKRRGFEVYIGENNQYEVDFVAIAPDNSIEYYQVALSTLDESTLKRELRSLASIDDQYPKYLLTLNQFNQTANYNGIQKLNALQWLMGE